jgi:hypothetical protein
MAAKTSRLINMTQPLTASTRRTRAEPSTDIRLPATR